MPLRTSLRSPGSRPGGPPRPRPRIAAPSPPWGVGGHNPQNTLRLPARASTTRGSACTHHGSAARPARPWTGWRVRVNDDDEPRTDRPPAGRRRAAAGARWHAGPGGHARRARRGVPRGVARRLARLPRRPFPRAARLHRRGLLLRCAVLLRSLLLRLLPVPAVLRLLPATSAAASSSARPGGGAGAGARARAARELRPRAAPRRTRRRRRRPRRPLLAHCRSARPALARPPRRHAHDHGAPRRPGHRLAAGRRLRRIDAGRRLRLALLIAGEDSALPALEGGRGGERRDDRP